MSNLQTRADKKADREAARIAAANERQLVSDKKLAKRKAEREAEQAKRKADVVRIGQEIAARIIKVDEAKASIKEKAGREVKNVIDHADSIEKLLAEAKDKCKAAGMTFEEFRKEYAPDYSRAKVYELVALGNGTLLIEDKRASAAERKRKSRGTGRVASTLPTENGREDLQTPRSTGNGGDPMGAEIRKAQAGNKEARKQLLDAGYTETMDGDGKPLFTPPSAKPPEAKTLPTSEAEAETKPTFGSVKRSEASVRKSQEAALQMLGKTPWDQFKVAIEILMPLMNIPTRVEARKLVTTVSNKADVADREAA